MADALACGFDVVRGEVLVLEEQGEGNAVGFGEGDEGAELGLGGAILDAAHMRGVEADELGGLELGKAALDAQEAKAKSESPLLAPKSAHDAGPLEELGDAVVGPIGHALGRGLVDRA
jgi:hypothetical protein